MITIDFAATFSAMREVRDRELWRELGHESFTEYCRDRWDVDAAIVSAILDDPDFISWVSASWN